MKLWVVFAVLVVPLALAGSVSAHTWSVQKDGSGDYVSIQPALDAAADGDTVMIGAGEFTEYTMVRLPGYTWDVAVFAYAWTSSLTVIGEGSTETIIGPIEPMIDAHDFSAKCFAWIGSGRLILSGVTLRNCYEGVHIPQGRIDVSSCKFEGNYIGVVWKASAAGGSIVDAVFTSPFLTSLSVQVFGPGANVVMRRVTSIHGGELYFDSVTNILVDDCDIRESSTGIVVWNGAGAIVRNSRIQDNIGSQIYVNAAACDIDSCQIGGGETALNADYQSIVSVAASELSGGSVSTVYLYYPEEVVINGSHILKGAGHAVYNAGPTSGPLLTRDLTNNFWGTSEPDSIAAWIWDRRDSPDSPGLINFEPFSAVAVPTEKKSLGSFKAMFRDATR